MTTTRRAAVRAARARRRRAATRPIRPPVAPVPRPSRDPRDHPGRVPVRPRIIVRLAHAAPADVRAALEVARHATRAELEVTIEPVASLPGGSPFSLRLPWRPIDGSAGRTWEDGEALGRFAAAFEAAFAAGTDTASPTPRPEAAP